MARQSDLAAADTAADDDHVQRGDRFVDQDGPGGRESDGSDAAILHARFAYGVVHPGKRDLANIESFADDSVDICSVAGTHQARCHHGHLGAPPGDHHAVRGDVQRHLVRRTELGCVRVAWIDASDEALQAKLGDRILDGSRQQLGMVTSWLPIQRADDVHQGRIIVRLTVADAEDARLSDYVRLRETSLRRHLESERGLFIAEGEKVIRRAIEAGYQPRSFLLAERWLEGLSDVVQRWPAVPVFVVTEDLAEQVTGFHVHRGALASLHREQRHSVGDLVAMQRIVVLEDVVDHTNVGAILRNAAALGWNGALLSPRAADPLYRRSIKVSMGAVFSLPWARLDDWAGAPDMLATAGFMTVALSLAPDAVQLDELVTRITPQTKLAVMLGTEGGGLSTRWSAGAAARTRIPMFAGIDSLNVAAAAAIACYALSARGVTGQSSG